MKASVERGSLVLRIFFLVCLFVGLVLMGINLYGLTQPIRMPGLQHVDESELRFSLDNYLSYEESIKKIDQLKQYDSKYNLTGEANELVNASLVHVDWNRVDPVKYRQLVPIWENFFLWAIGKFSGLPQFSRYHFAGYQRSIERGIGICGDASIVLSSILDKYGIENNIISFPGHVIVEFKDENDNWFLMDPDFGVDLNTSLEKLVENPADYKERYYLAGYSEKEVDYLFSLFSKDYKTFDDVYHFMTLRFIFEKASYIAKWLLPALLILISGFWLFRVFLFKSNAKLTRPQ